MTQKFRNSKKVSKFRKMQPLTEIRIQKIEMHNQTTES